MAQTFFFYDLETSGLNPREDRIMQFAGIRTDLDLNPIGEKYNFLIKLSDDILPSPEAILTTGITPRQTLDDGYTEAEAAKILHDEIFTEETIAVGYNNVRFDDEFVRHLFWRNYYDPYEWGYRDGRSRWDLLDVVRMVRALRPDGINWPVDDDGKSTNRLELLSKVNGLEHEKAHDALSDVEALIAVAKLIKQKQPKMWQYLFNMRDKNAVTKLVNLREPKPFVYSSGRLNSEFNKTTIMLPVAEAKNHNLLVYDLRYDPLSLVNKTAEDLENELAQWSEIHPGERPPTYVKEFKLNRCPAVAPLSVVSEISVWQNIGLELGAIKHNLANLKAHPEVIPMLKKWYEQRNDRWEELYSESSSERITLAESQLYDGFIDSADKFKTQQIPNFTQKEVADFVPDFNDKRLNDLWMGYKARSFDKLLTKQEREAWNERRSAILAPQVQSYLLKLQELAIEKGKSASFYLEDLRLWLENLLAE
ncbi:MAG: exodeoxyribonuclease I [Candidatus Saccharibacteria bacterium]|nr:exodeoxyribonuclease I [Candidatus Saccharibacteria bacterium]